MQESHEKFKLLMAVKMWFSSTRIHMGQQANTTWRLIYLFRHIKRPLPWIITGEDSSFKAVFTNMEITECKWLAHDGQKPDGD